MTRTLITLFTIISLASGFAQDLPIYRQYYLNPSILNPALNGISDFMEVNMYYRQQWVQVDDAPSVFGINVQIPTLRKFFFGADIYTHETVLIRNSSALITAGYALPLATDHHLRFALAGGIGQNALDLTEEELNTTDEAILQAMGTNFYLDGRFGVAYTFKHLEVGISLPRLFSTRSFSSSEFNNVEFSEFDYRIFYLGYKHNFSSDFALRPQVVLFQNSGIDELGGMLGMHYKDILWVGASYRNVVGAFAGIKIKNLLLQYNYELSSFPGNTFDNSSHGVQLSLRLGNKKHSSPQSSSYPTSTSDEEVSPVEDAHEQEDTKEIIPTNDEKEAGNPPAYNKENQAREPVTTQPNTKRNDSAKMDYTQEKELKNLEDVEETTDINSPDFDSGLLNRRGGLNMTSGYYIVVGVFRIIENAIRQSKTAIDNGFSADIVINPKNNYYYVFVYYHPESRKKAVAVRKAFRKTHAFKDAWLMEVK